MFAALWVLSKLCGFSLVPAYVVELNHAVAFLSPSDHYVYYTPAFANLAITATRQSPEAIGQSPIAILSCLGTTDHAYSIKKLDHSYSSVQFN